MAIAVDPSIPPPGAPANWISIEAFQQLLHTRFQGAQAAHVAKRAFVDSNLDKLFSAAVQKSQVVRNNVMSLAQWLVSSVTTENLLPIFGTLRYDELETSHYFGPLDFFELLQRIIYRDDCLRKLS